MISRSLRILVEVGVVCILLLAAGLFWISHYIDTVEFRNRFTNMIQDFTGRHVTLSGDLNIALWPGFVLDVEDLSLGEDQEFGNEEFVHFDRIRISVRLIPLLAERLDIRLIIVEGMKLSIIQKSDGRFNWQSIQDMNVGEISLDSSSDFSIHEISLSGLEVVNASVSYKDDTGDRGYLLSGINLRTGAMAVGEDVPFTISSAFSWVGGGVESDLILKGMLETGVDGSGVALKDATLYASVGGDFLPDGANPGELTARVLMDWDRRSIAFDAIRVQFLGLKGEGNIQSSDLSKEFRANGHVTIHPFRPVDVVTRYFPKAPVKSVDGLKNSNFSSVFQVDETGVTFKDLVLSLDDMKVRGQLGFSNYKKPVFSFELSGNTIDLDRYLPLFRTDTPFVWDDFNLELFRKFRGQGTVGADGFKVLDTHLSDISLAIKADINSILVDAAAIKKGQASLNGTMKVIIGSSATDAMPVLTMSAQLAAKSMEEGFVFLKGKSLSLFGMESFQVKADVASLPCPPLDRSIEILRHVTGNGSLSLGTGFLQYDDVSGKPFKLDYSKANIAFGVTPAKRVSEGYFDYIASANIEMHGGEKVETLAVKAKGPMRTAIDSLSIKTSGMDISGHITSQLLPRESKRLLASGTVSFDSDTAVAAVSDGVIHVLETSIKGTANITGLGKTVQASGKLVIPEADPKRIIYLLSGVAVRTNDVEALKSARLETQYTADKKGFTLSELKGNLDGMSFNGHVIGNGLKNPMLAFSLSSGFLDIDRYLPPSPDMSLEERRAGKVKKAPPVELPLGFLKALRLNGKAVLEEFKLAGIRVRPLSGNVRADNGQVHLSELKGTVHEGQLMADWSGDVGTNELKTHLKLHIEDMQSGALLKDIAKRDYIRGKSDVDFDLVSTGATDDEILKYLHGTAWTRTSNGSFKFSGYETKPVVTRNNLMTDDQNTQTRPSPRTSFRKAMAYFTVNKGVFSVDKFRLEAPPLLQSYGEGNFSLPDNSIDLSIKNDFVAVPSVTIQIVGQLSDPEIKIPKGKIVNDTVRNILSLPEKSFNFLRDLFH
ncbi:MAG: AsmA family protein [Pseudodesulfovibrio sp.]|nr:AsmA family protein [Pseudodesulfovibrio sp.]